MVNLWLFSVKDKYNLTTISHFEKLANTTLVVCVPREPDFYFMELTNAYHIKEGSSRVLGDIS